MQVITYRFKLRVSFNDGMPICLHQLHYSKHC